jgi:protein TonB
MFDQTFVEGRQKTRKPYTVVLSLFVQISTMCILMLIPLVYTQSLPNTQLKSMLVAPPPPPAASPPRPAVKITTRFAPRLLNAHTVVAPRVIPKTVNPVNEIAAPEVSVFGSTGVDTNSNAGITGILGSAITTDAPPPAAVPPKSKPAPAPVPIGGRVAEANIIHKVQPVYPALARSARIQGNVEFTATISKDGAIENLQLIHGHPLLVNAAREAVLQWRYRPTLLNGQPVEVVTTIVVRFMLSQ